MIDLEKVKKNGNALRFVKNQTEAICIAAVLQDGYALRFVKKPTTAICMAAVCKNGYAIEHVKKPTLLMQKISIIWAQDPQHHYWETSK